MLLELLVVAAVVMYLHALGFVEFDDPWSVASALSIGAVAAAVLWVILRVVAGKLISSMFGFSSWAPKSRPAVKAAKEKGDIRALEKIVRNSPREPEASRALTELYLRAGRTEDFVREKVRILEKGTLTRAEATGILHRLADIEIEKGRPGDAVAYLNRLIDKYPDTADAANAKHRCAVIQERINTGAGEEAGRE